MVCGGCKGFFSQKRIWRHKRICTGSNITKNVSLAAATLCSAYTRVVPDDFRNEVLVRFRNDEVGNSCRTDNMLVLFGQKLWAKSIRRDKKVIMTDMRTLGNLLVQVRKDTKKPTFSGEELFVYTNFNLIEYAIEQITENEDGSMKAGLKLNLGYLIKKAAKMMKGQYIIGQKLDMAKNIDRFLSVLDLNWDFIFYRAQMIVEGKRDAVLRKPQAMPIESDITKLHDFTELEMENLIKDEFKKWDAHDFIKLRSLIVCRLTMFNARRGGEPARLTMKEWQDAEANVWVDPQLVMTVTDPYEASLVDQYKLAYQSGKGSRKLVPVLIPNDTIAPLRKLCEQRVEVDVNLLNPYLFPLTQSSKCHVQGWDCVNSVVKIIGNVLERPSLLTADKFRHRASTLYAMLDIPQQEREAFYRHMGYSAEVNKNIYQCPLAI